MSTTKKSAPPPALAVLFFRDALSRASHLKNETYTLSDYEYRSPTPPRVAKLIHDIVEHGENAIRDEWAEYRRANTDEDRRTILNNVQVWDSMLRMTGGRLRYIIGASAPRVPSGLGLLLETIIQDQGLGDGILLREKWTYNYSIDITPIEQLYYNLFSGILATKDLASIFGDEGALSSTYAIGFPAIERNNTLLHCAIAHEIGHIAVERWLTQNYDSDTRATSDSRAAATRLINPETVPPNLEEWGEILAAMSRIHTARRRFLQEYGSDIYAVELFGPAALLSMANIAMSQGLDSEPGADAGYYPSWRSRLRFALDWLNRESPDSWLPRPTPNNSWAVALASHLSHIDHFLGPMLVPTNPEMAEADRLAKQTLVLLGQDLAARIPLKRRESMEQAYLLADRIAELIPPNDIGSDQRQPVPPYLWAILNAGWLHTIHASETNAHALDDEDDSGVVNRLILKALSDVIVMRGFRQHQEATTTS